MRLSDLRGRMVLAILAVFFVAILFAIAVLSIIELVANFLFNGVFYLQWALFQIPFTDWIFLLPANFPLAIIIGSFLVLLQWAIGPTIIRGGLRIRTLDREKYRWLYQEVETLAQDAGIPMPKLALSKNPTPNAFVFGRTVKGSTLVVHQGLLESLNPREMRAVLGHELGHLGNRDIIIMTLASAVPLIAYMILQGTFEGGRVGLLAVFSGDGGDSDDAGFACLVIIVAIFVIALLAALTYGSTLLVVRGLSRIRELYADAYSATLTKDPYSLQSALAKITYGLSLQKKKGSGLRTFYISDPNQAVKEAAYIRSHRYQFDLDKDGVLDDRELLQAMETEASRHELNMVQASLATHPPTFKRILQLKELQADIDMQEVLSAREDEERISLETI
ncbi:MAG: M48 family metalloprotease [Candidatus Thorarchaeota archaeon]